MMKKFVQLQDATSVLHDQTNLNFINVNLTISGKDTKWMKIDTLKLKKIWMILIPYFLKNEKSCIIYKTIFHPNKARSSVTLLLLTFWGSVDNLKILNMLQQSK